MQSSRTQLHLDKPKLFSLLICADVFAKIKFLTTKESIEAAVFKLSSNNQPLLDLVNIHGDELFVDARDRGHELVELPVYRF